MNPYGYQPLVWTPVYQPVSFSGPGAWGLAPGAFSVGVTSPSTLFNRMDEVDAAVQATDASITLRPVSGPKGDDFTKRWKDWLSKWDQFNANERSIVNLLSPALWLSRSDEALRETEARAQQHDQLRAEYLSLGGHVTGPSIPKLPSSEPAQSSAVSVLQWAALAAAIIGGTALLLTYAPEIKGLFHRGRK